MLHSSDGHVFMAYLKIRKPGIPLRPIVSFVNSPRILSLVVGNTDYTVKNSCEFADFIRDKTLNAYEELVSFDVISLFTKIPIDLAVKVAAERLREDASLGQRISFPVEDIIHLLSFSIRTTQFAYNGTHYTGLCCHCQHANERRGIKGRSYFTC